MKTLITLNIVSFILVPFVSYAELQIDQKANVIFSKSDQVNQLAIYKISPRSYSEADAQIKLDWLKSQGFIWTSKVDSGNFILYKNESTDQYMAYIPEKSEYRYKNKKIGGLTDSDLADTNHLQAIANNYLLHFLGEDANNYFLSNKEYEWTVIRKNDYSPRLHTLTFRYVRVLDGRQIKGTTSQALITIGQGGILAFLSINNPKLEKVSNLARKIKNSAMENYLRTYIATKKYTTTPDGNDIPIKDTRIVKAWESYFVQNRGKNLFLIPHMSFFSIDSLTDGTAIQREFHISADASMVENTEPNDIIMDGKSSKR